MIALLVLTQLFQRNNLSKLAYTHLLIPVRVNTILLIEFLKILPAA